MNMQHSVSTILPREGSLMYGFIKGTIETRKKAVSKFKILNKYVMVPLYRFNILPFFLIGRVMVLLYSTGRKSGKRRIVPVEYHYYNDKLLLFSSRGKKGDWYQNILANPETFKLKKGFRMYKPKVKSCSYEEKLEIMEWYSDKFPKLAKRFYGFVKGQDSNSEATLKPVAEFIEILKCDLN